MRIQDPQIGVHGGAQDLFLRDGLAGHGAGQESGKREREPGSGAWRRSPGPSRHRGLRVTTRGEAQRCALIELSPSPAATQSVSCGGPASPAAVWRSRTDATQAGAPRAKIIRRVRPGALECDPGAR
jgi:hypothetical protein